MINPYETQQFLTARAAARLSIEEIADDVVGVLEEGDGDDYMELADLLRTRIGDVVSLSKSHPDGGDHLDGEVVIAEIEEALQDTPYGVERPDEVAMAAEEIATLFGLA